jgi:hypothetical protein
MKTATTTIGIVILSLLSVGTLFKAMNWPGANPLLILSVGLLFFFLVILLVLNLNTESSDITKAAQGLGTVAGLIFSNGILFKIMHWPGANVMLLLGMLVLFFVFVPLYLIGMKQNKIEGRLNTHTIIVLSIFAMLMIAYAGKKPAYNLMQDFCKVNSRLSGLIKYSNQYNANIYSMFQEKLQAAPDSFHACFDKAMALKMRSENMRQYIEHIKIELVSMCEGIQANDSTDLSSIQALDNYVVPTFYMLSEDPESNLGKAYELREKILLYKKDIVSCINTPVQIHFGLDVEDKIGQDGIKYSWPQYYFHYTTLAGAITTLTELEVEIENTETNVLLEILKESELKNAQSQSK